MENFFVFRPLHQERLRPEHFRDLRQDRRTALGDQKIGLIDHRQPVYENPSPGNKAGGITTLEDKSLGCTQKAGTSKVTDVLDYGEVLRPEAASADEATRSFPGALSRFSPLFLKTSP